MKLITFDPTLLKKNQYLYVFRYKVVLQFK